VQFRYIDHLYGMKQHISIVGGGLAGSFLGLRLVLAGHAVTLFDEQVSSSASRVAAGLFNVITGRYGAKSWQAELLLEEIRAFFGQEACRELQQHLHYVPIYRPFRQVSEYNKWVGRSADPAYAGLVRLAERPVLEGGIHNELGGIFILPCGWADTRALLKHTHQLIGQYGGRVVPEPLTYSRISIEKKIIETDSGNLPFDQIVFCEGYQAINNPFFPGLKVIPNKGDLLLIEAETLNLPFVLSRKVFVIPLGEHRYLAGSTYENDCTEAKPSAAARAEICYYLDAALKVPYRVLDQRAGIRPTTPNRRPIVGTHPQWPWVHLLNGLGTKGMLLAPYCSRLLAQRIGGQAVSIPPEAGLDRFWQK